MRKWLALCLVFCLMFTIVACSEKSNDTDKTDVDYSRYAGEYYDEFSGRATATVKASEDGKKALVEIHWGASVSEMDYWTMSFTEKDGKLVYSDCKYQKLGFDTDGNNVSEETVYENGSGYFTWTEGRLSWNGAGEESCRQCVFVVAPN